ncbi:MAG: YceD family protein [Thermoleophilaceae bacterium]
MAHRADSFDLATLRLSSGEAASVDLTVTVDRLEFAGERYAPAGGEAGVRLDVSRTTGAGYALRLRYGVELEGPCMRCLEPAVTVVEIDAREVDQPDGGDAGGGETGGDEDLRSPYMQHDELDLRAWTRDALALALPTQIVCREDCRGLCPVCGESLNADPEHAHEPEHDPRWAKLSELKLE